MTPRRPAESPHRRRDTRPSLLSPSPSSAFAAAADVDHDAAADEPPSVMLLEWWLANVEGDDQKIAVAGIFRANQILYELSPAPIKECHAPNILEAEDGTILLISGSLDNLRTLGNGYSDAVCKHFMAGFPFWWQKCNMRYPKLTNPTPRFEQHTCDGDIAANQNAAASSEAGKGGQRTPVVTLEVRGCREDTQHMALTEKAAVDEEMRTSLNLDVQNKLSVSNGAPIMEEYTCDVDIPTNEDGAASNDDNERYTAPSKEANNMGIGLIAGSPSSTPATVACLKNQGSWEENQHIASNEKMKLIDSCLGKQPVCRPKKQISPHAKCQSATRSPGTRNPAPYVLRSPLTSDKAIPLSMSTPEDLKRKRSRSDRKRTTVASLKSQGSWRENQPIASNKKPVDRPQKQISPREKCQSATRSPVTRISISCAHLSLWSPPTRGKDTPRSMTPVEALKLKRSRSGRIMVPKLDEGCQSIAYGTDGSIAGVIGLDSPAVLEWSEPKTGRRKKRKTK